MSYTNDMCRSHFTRGQYDRALSLFHLTEEAYIDINATFTTGAHNNLNLVFGHLTSTHPVQYWIVAIGDNTYTTPIGSSQQLDINFDGLVNGDYVANVTACYH